MTGLLPKEIIKSLLDESGVFGRPHRLIRTAGKYKPFTVTRKKSDLDVKAVEKTFAGFLQILDRDWRPVYFKEATLTREEGGMISLRKGRFVKGAFCSVMTVAESKDPVLIYFNPVTVYRLLAKYFGSNGLSDTKKGSILTEIEVSFLEKILEGMAPALGKAFAELCPVTVATGMPYCPEVEQKEFLKNDHYASTFILKTESAEYPFTVCLPPGFLDVLKSGMDKKSSAAERELDPLWQETIKNVVSRSDVTVSIHVGGLVLPFSRSCALKVGDVIPWERTQGAKVEVAFLGATRMSGSIGTVGENYAVQIETVA